MIINNTNHQKDDNKIENNKQQSWILQLVPISLTLIPSDQTDCFADKHKEL